MGLTLSESRSNSNKPLKLRADTPEDLSVFAAILQDALLPLRDAAYLKAEGRFVMVLNRFRWENDTVGEMLERKATEDADFNLAVGHYPGHQRVNCGLCFEQVESVRYRDIRLEDRDQILNLMTLSASDQTILLAFSGGGAIRLGVSKIRCYLQDLGEAWPTIWRPFHPQEEGLPEPQD